MENKNYKLELWQEAYSDGSIEWIAKYPDLNNIIGVGETIQEAISEAEIFKQMYFETLEKEKKEYPINSLENNYSGRITLRVSKKVHRIITEESKKEGISINSFINESILHWLGEKEVVAYDKKLDELKEVLLHKGFINEDRCKPKYSNNVEFPKVK